MSTAYEDAMAELNELQGSNAIIYGMPRITEVPETKRDIWGFLAAIGVLGFYVLGALSLGFAAVDLYMKWRR